MNFNQKEKIWSVRYIGDADARKSVEALSKLLGVSEVCAELIYNRGYSCETEAREFLNANIDVLHDPYLMKDMDLAVKRIHEAIGCGEKITVYGDYDVDGVTSVSLAYLYFKSQGAIIDYYIPSRDKEGYGVSVSAINKLSESGTNLIITVDTGITANSEVEYAKSIGIDTVVTDHHECYASIPNAVAVVNPHRHDCDYPFAELAGVGVVFKLVCAYEKYVSDTLSMKECERRICDGYLDLVSIGTVADVMPLRDENRFIVSEGIKKIEDTNRVGLSALIETASVSARPATNARTKLKKKKINAGFIGFTLAPRINAAGRISSACKAVELLLCDNHDDAMLKARELCEINSQRQIEENKIAEQAYKMIDGSHDFEHDKVIVLDNDSWQQGIIGIVASRITEKYGLPSILISYDGATRGFECNDDLGKGSGRSIKGLNLVEALGYCSELLQRFGGHELAAGLSVRRGDVELFRRKINEYAREKLDEDDTKIRYEVDCELKFEQLTMDLAKEIEMLEPFGVSNSTPTFLVKNLEIDRIAPLGAGNHCKIFFGGDGQGLSAVCFGVAASKFDFYKGEHVDILCRVGINEFRGEQTLQLVLQDIRHAEDYKILRDEENQRLAEILGGAKIKCSENVVPTRDEIAFIYKLIRYEVGLGRGVMSDRAFDSLVYEHTKNSINYIKLKLILHILLDMEVISVSELSDNIYEFDIIKNAKKTSVENSEVFRMISTGYGK